MRRFCYLIFDREFRERADALARRKADVEVLGEVLAGNGGG